jgi:hypothetical protein
MNVLETVVVFDEDFVLLLNQREADAGLVEI